MSINKSLSRDFIKKITDTYFEDENKVDFTDNLIEIICKDIEQRALHGKYYLKKDYITWDNRIDIYKIKKYFKNLGYYIKNISRNEYATYVYLIWDDYLSIPILEIAMFIFFIIIIFISIVK